MSIVSVSMHCIRHKVQFITHKNSSQPQCFTERNKIWSLHFLFPSWPCALIICQSDRCSSNDGVSCVLNFYQSSAVRDGQTPAWKPLQTDSLRCSSRGRGLSGRSAEVIELISNSTVTLADQNSPGALWLFWRLQQTFSTAARYILIWAENKFASSSASAQFLNTERRERGHFATCVFQLHVGGKHSGGIIKLKSFERVVVEICRVSPHGDGPRGVFAAIFPTFSWNH